MAMHHQKLVVYQKSLDFIFEVLLITRSARPGWGDVCNQLKRAAASVVLNIAEGAGEFSPGEKARFYRMAIRSATESHAACDVMVRTEIIPEAAIVQTQRLAEEIVSMLIAMCKKVEARI